MIRVILLVLALVGFSSAAQAQCVGTGGINTIANCPPASQPIAADLLWSYQVLQNPHSRKMTLAQVAGYVAGQFPNVTEVSCGGVDDTALIQGLFTTLASGPYSGRVGKVHGQCVLTTAITATLSTTAALIGDGKEVTTFTFSNATDGFNIMLDRPASKWGGLISAGFSILRGPTSPAAANTAFKVYANPAIGSGYYGETSFTDIRIWGSSNVTGWSKALYLSSLVNTSLTGININGVPATATDTGDVAITLDGVSSTMYGVQYGLNAVNVAGYSCGVCMTGYVQGVNLGNNTSILANYDNVRWISLGTSANFTTTGSTSLGGTTLQFAAGSIAAMGNVLNGTGLSTDTIATNINNTTGVVTISPAATGAVSLGGTISAQQGLSGEALTITNSTFSGVHRDVYCSFCSLSAISNSTFLRFPGLNTWVGIEMHESNNWGIANNQLLGPSGGSSGGILVSSPNAGIGATANTIIGNSSSTIVGGPAISLTGAVTNTTVVGNSCNGCTGGGVVADAGSVGNTIGPNSYNGATEAVKWSGPLTVGTDTGTGGLQINLNSSSSGARNIAFLTATNARWLWGVTGAETGSNAGADVIWSRYKDDGTILEAATFQMFRSTGRAQFSQSVGFNGTAPIAKQTPVGACAGNTGCQALRDALGAMGLINTGSITN